MHNVFFHAIPSNYVYACMSNVTIKAIKHNATTVMVHASIIKHHQSKCGTQSTQSKIIWSTIIAAQVHWIIYYMPKIARQSSDIKCIQRKKLGSYLAPGSDESIMCWSYLLDMHTKKKLLLSLIYQKSLGNEKGGGNQQVIPKFLTLVLLKLVLM